MLREQTRTRQGGTIVTVPKSPQERIAAVRQILTHGYAKIDGCMVDSFSASAIVAVYDALNETNRERFASFTVARMADIAFKLIKK